MADLFIFFAAAAFVLAGLVKGVIGFGLPTVAIALLGLVIAPAQAAALMVVPSFATNVWQSLAGPALARLVRRLWPMLLGICVGTWAGSGLITQDENGHAAMMLGIALAAYAVLGLNAVSFSVSPHAEPWLSPVVGTATGLVTAATGVFVIPAVPYLQALALEKEDLVQALGLSFTVSTVTLGASLAHHDVFQVSVAAGSLRALAPALLGMVLGQRIRAVVSPVRFRFFFFLGLLVLGGHLAIREIL